ncbi:glycoside hydrolase family 43 protein [Bifidobacterium felsineum]|uniref:Beta-xylosidase n=1 Tax=Bifidobacterium felsineum TaxID=2045440 RepID=A0A2M9HIK1_9BIFI|nr:glycoside hydrolase family 43 protein [Bifidobacterium felsineum]MBT1164879.1 glycoside hydrolase family 43 protein [Bifidobacterium felsineum]PJM76645.1 beta-xylosidase [Bifidobacterium felsineum]
MFATIAPLTGRTYVNPTPYADGNIHTAPDPFVIRYRSLYYCYATDEHGILVSTSPDLVHWTSRGYCYTEVGRKNYWAPSVILINGVFHMYFSNMPENEVDTHNEIMRVATSVDPLGPFEKRAELFNTFAIDSQVVWGDDGQLYLLYADNQVTGLSEDRPGTSVMIDRLVTPFVREDKPRPLIVPTMDEEIFARNRFGDGRDWHTVEGATYFTYRDRAFITYSANAYEHEDYFVGYSTAPLPSDPAQAHVDTLDWTKHLNSSSFDPLLIRSPQVEGTGHNSIVKAPNAIDDWIVYHGRNAADELYVGTEQRVMRIDPLYYAENGLDTLGPTADEQDAPLSGNIQDDFAQGLADQWTLISGAAHASAGASSDEAASAALIADESGTFLAVAGEPSATQVLDVWAKAPVTPLGARFGLIVRYTDDHNLTKVEIDAGRRLVSVIDVIGGVASERVVRTGFEGFDFVAWHDYRVERRYCRLDVTIDGRVFESCTISDRPGRAGLFALRTAAAFSAYVATEHVDLWGARLRDFGREIQSSGLLTISDGVRPHGVKPADITLRAPLHGNRFVLDFASQTDRGQTLIAMGDYRLSITTAGVELMHDGTALDAVVQPERLRELNDQIRRDQFGRAIVTVRIESLNSLLRIHVRGKSWQVPLGEDGLQQACITLDRTALTGYTRTALVSANRKGA